MAPSAQGIISFVVAVLPLLIGHNSTEQEIADFLLAVAPSLAPGGPTSGQIPQFRLGDKVYGPIPFGPVP